MAPPKLLQTLPKTRHVCYMSRSSQRCSGCHATRPRARLCTLRCWDTAKRSERERNASRPLSAVETGNTSFEGRTTTQNTPEQAGTCGRLGQRNPQGGHEDVRSLSGPLEALSCASPRGAAGVLQQSRAKLRHCTSLCQSLTALEDLDMLKKRFDIPTWSEAVDSTERLKEDAEDIFL